jgi:hypothetical protein
MGEKTKRTTWTNGYRSRWATGGTTAMIGLIALVMAVSSASGTIVTHPYKGANLSRFSYSDVYGCASEKVSAKPTMSLTTGAGGWAAAASAKTPCGTVVGSFGQSSDFYGDAGFDIAIPLALHTGQTNVTVNLNAKGVLSTAITGGSVPGKCPVAYSYSYYLNSTYYYNYYDGYCDVYAEAYFDSYGYVKDMTNNTYYYENWTNWGTCYSFGYCYNEVYNESYNDTSFDYGCYDYNYASPVCYSYNFTGASPTTSSSQSINVVGGMMSFTSNSNYNGHSGWVFNSKHKYVLFIEMYGGIDASVYNVNHSTAKASINFNPSLGNGWTLNNVVIS